eukprot:142688_1
MPVVSIAVHMRDYIFMIALIGCTLIVFSDWDGYSECRDPLNVWLVVDFLSFVLFRVIQFLFQWSVGGNFNTHRYVPTILAFFNLYFVYPFLWAWTGIGSFWYARSSQSESCLPENRNNFWFITWIAYSFLYLFAFGGLIISTYRRRDRENTNVFEAILANFYRSPFDGILAVASNGLSRAEINAIPTRKLNRREAATLKENCSICLNPITGGQTVRQLICLHLFHKRCLDRWLAIKNTCPNCVQRVNTERTSLVSSRTVSLSFESYSRDTASIRTDTSSDEIAESFNENALYTSLNSDSETSTSPTVSQNREEPVIISNREYFSGSQRNVNFFV